TGGHGPVLLDRMAAVPFCVQDVVDVVDRGRGGGERNDRDQRVADPVVPPHGRAGQRRGQHEQGLRPLPRPGRPYGSALPPKATGGRRGEPASRATHRAYTAVKSRSATE